MHNNAVEEKWDLLKHTPITGLTISIGLDVLAAQDSFAGAISDTSVVMNFISGHQWAIKLMGPEKATNNIYSIKVYDQSGNLV